MPSRQGQFGLGELRHRSEVVEDRVAQNLERIGDRLQKLGIVTGALLRHPQGPVRKRPAITEVTTGRKVLTNGPG